MSKYKVGDKVVIRKDLEISKKYGDCWWYSDKDYLKEKDYVVIGVEDVGNYYIKDGWLITDEMIKGLYKEDKEMNIKTRDKVRVIKSVDACNTIKKGDVVEVDSVENDIVYVKGHKYSADGSKYWLWADEFELVEEKKKYIWYLDSEDGTYFVNDLLGVDKWSSHEIQEIKKGKDACYILTEEEAKQSPFFDKFTKHDPFEKWYYIRMKGSEGYLNLDTNNNVFFAYSNALCSYKYKFTEEECNEIIGTSSILYKEECQHD